MSWKGCTPPSQFLTTFLVLKQSISPALSSACLTQGLLECHLTHQQANSAASVNHNPHSTPAFCLSGFFTLVVWMWGCKVNLWPVSVRSYVFLFSTCKLSPKYEINCWNFQWGNCFITHSLIGHSEVPRVQLAVCFSGAVVKNLQSGGCHATQCDANVRVKVVCCSCLGNRVQHSLLPIISTLCVLFECIYFLELNKSTFTAVHYNKVVSTCVVYCC